MKILVIGHALVVEEYQALLLEMAQAGHEILLITPKCYRESGRLIKVKSTAVAFEHLALSVFLGRLGKQQLHFYYNIIKIVRFARKFRPDICYLYEEAYSTVTTQIVAIIRAVLPEARVMLWTSDNRNRRYLHELKWYDPRRYLLRFNERFNQRNSQGIIATTQDALRIQQAKSYRRAIFLTATHFINTQLFYPDSRSALRDGIRFGIIGRLVPMKGLDILLRALSLLKGELATRKARLVVIGEGREHQFCRKLAGDLGVEDYIDWQRFVPYHEIPAVMRSLDFLVVPSRDASGKTEKFGRIVIEAMACRLPVIVSNSGYLPKLVDRSALVFPEENYQELAGCIRSYLADEDLRQEMAVRGYERVLARYTVQAVAARLLKAFSLIHRSGQEPMKPIYQLGDF